MNIEFISLYRNLLTSEKLQKECSILNIFFENQRTCSFYSKIITDNEKHIIELNSSFQTIVVKNLAELSNFIKDEKYDMILFVNMFSFYSKEDIERILKVFEMECDSYFAFVNEIIYKNSLLKHPFSYIRDFLFKISDRNYGRSVSIDEVHSLLQKNAFKILDSTRILSRTSIPTYPVEYFLIVTKLM